MRKRTLTLILLVGLILFAFPVKAQTDLVSRIEGHWAERDMAYLLAKGVIDEYGPGAFKPNEPITRAQFGKMMVLALGYGPELPTLEHSRSPFPDVPDDHWAKGPIVLAWELGLLVGHGDGTLKPEDQITRAELAAVVVRTLGDISLPAGYQHQFTDDDQIPDWAQLSARIAHYRGLVAGHGDGRFGPDEPTTCAQAAAIVTRLMGQFGSIYDLAGTVIQRQGYRLVVDYGQGTQDILVAPNAFIYKNDDKTTIDGITPLDQVRLVINEGGLVTYVNAAYLNTRGTLTAVDPEDRTITLQPEGTGETIPLKLLADAPVFVQGRTGSLSELIRGDRIYAVLDYKTGMVRYLDATRFTHTGVVKEVNLMRNEITITTPLGKIDTLYVFDTNMVFINGTKSQLRDLLPGDTVSLYKSEYMSVTYIEAEREVSANE